MKSNKTLSKAYASGMGVLFLSFLFISPSLAQVTPTATITPTTKPSITKSVKETAKQKCDRIKLIIADKKANFLSGSEKQLTPYNGVVKNGEEMISMLESTDADLTTLKTDLAALKAKLQERAELRKSLYFSVLEKVQAIQCGTAKKEDLKQVFETKKAEYLAAKPEFNAQVKILADKVKQDMKDLNGEIKALKVSITPSKIKEVKDKKEKAIKPSITAIPTAKVTETDDRSGSNKSKDKVKTTITPTAIEENI